ncbi:hypothetical protein A5757_04275 [Mycobacterium sp. 852013-51886_SCH5428379]|uniref:Rv1815 family serine proteinase n=1 Tax=Mycobacterium sp. 852013-51886_SCH5428379 TaxID=1834111 RepID=UPI0007FBB005|nr:hypothetical protein [Mycobacterium sp. 852013-51886_SCH5428379]OBB55714.1 hypothetical protein A5757_04275 [Mycobacterium sp. 852013-51886_SCH5428379]
MRRLLLSVLAAAAAFFAMLLAPPAPGQADPGIVVFPGMEIRQGTNVCTLGFVDMETRVAYTAGHCRGGAQVTDKANGFLGSQVAFSDNTPDGTTVDTNHQISDWQTIALASDVQLNNVLPNGRPLVRDASVTATRGMPVCHFGVMTGESCGTVEAVNNGWFTMANGVRSQKGDSGGPVYTNTPDGRAVILGIYNSTWGSFPAAVSWQAVPQQAGTAPVLVTAGAA